MSIRLGQDVDLSPARLREGLGEGGSTSAAPVSEALAQPLPQAGGGLSALAPLPQLTIPYLFARRFGVVIQHTGTDGHLTLALREGADPKALIEVRRHLARPFDVAVVDAPAFDRLLSDAYAMDGQANALAAVGMGDELDSLAEGLPTAEDLLDTADDAPAIRLINGIIADAARNGVSDIHIEPYETGLVVLTNPVPPARSAAG